MQVALTQISRNVKTGPMPTSMTSAKSCPLACPLSGNNGCYAEAGPTNIHWTKVTKETQGVDWNNFLTMVRKLRPRTLWRHNVAGDLPSNDRKTIDSEKLAGLVSANRGKDGFTYTHYDVIDNKENRSMIKEANDSNFTINLSGNNLEHADLLVKADCGPVVTILPSNVTGNQNIFTPNGNRVSVCPATYREDVTCFSCGLCQKKNRKVIVGFPAHGVFKKKANVIAS